MARANADWVKAGWSPSCEGAVQVIFGSVLRVHCRPLVLGSGAVSQATSITNVSAVRARWYMRWLAALLAGSLALTLASYVAIPVPPVPITLQTLAVVLIGAFCGWRLGAVTIGAWLLEGAFGLPVFAGGLGGLPVLLGPSGGYLLAFPLVGALAGVLIARGWNGKRPLRAFMAMLAATLTCLFLGACWLALFAGPDKAWVSGVAIFVPGEVVKSAIATLALMSWQSLQRHRRHG